MSEEFMKSEPLFWLFKVF